MLLWCIPTLLIGLVLRSLLRARMPHALFLPDSEDYLTGARRLATGGHFEINSKKTFLIPVVYLFPYLAGLPLLGAIAVLQHLAGLMLVVITGFLCRLWFFSWRWFIVPLMIAMAVNPAMLWYEHAVMGEAIFVVCVGRMLPGFAWFWIRREWWACGGMLLGLLLVAGARPEGKLFLTLGYSR